MNSKLSCSALSPSHSKNIVLIIEDSEEDYEMFLRAKRKSIIKSDLIHYETGEEGLEYLSKVHEIGIPNLIILDLNLPGIDGRDVLKIIKNDPSFQFIPVIIFSTSSNKQDISDCYSYGANSYLIKPMDVIRLEEDIISLLHYWLNINICKNTHNIFGR